MTKQVKTSKKRPYLVEAVDLALVMYAAKQPYWRKCPDCEAEEGALHKRGCDIEPCPYCGGQALQCFMVGGCHRNKFKPIRDKDRIPWSGFWPGARECVEFGWFAKRTGKSVVSCGPNEPGAQPDLIRLIDEAVWDRKQKRYVRSNSSSAPDKSPSTPVAPAEAALIGNRISSDTPQD